MTCPPPVDQSVLVRVFFVLNFVFWLFGFVSDLEFRISDLPYYSSTPKVKKCKKMVQKAFIFVNFCSIYAKKCK